MKKSLAIFVCAVALAFIMSAPSKASAQGVTITIGPGGYGGYGGYGYGYSYPRYGYGYGYPRYGYGYSYPRYGYPRARRYARRRYVRRHW